MDKVKQLLAELTAAQHITQVTLSNPRKKEAGAYTKVTVQPVKVKGGLHYQFCYHYANKVQHDNVLPNEAASKLEELLSGQFKQGLVRTKDADYQILLNKKQQATIMRKQATKTSVDLSHNRKKQYVLEEGTPVPFLVELGIMNAEGKVLAKKYDKFRQINRFLEMIADVVPYLNKERTLHIVDFGCGKSYLTFAMHDYLQRIQGLDVRIIGLDLKEDVIRHCSGLADKFGCGDSLRFLMGDIAQYNGLDRVDMVVTLHACDTATDAALEKAVRWGADVILSVPCCQHELFKQISSSALAPMLDHGIIKERFAALATDAARTKLLDLVGYKTQILEFIDMEHTPKNLLIRAVKPPAKSRRTEQELHKIAEAYLEFKRSLHISPYLERALEDRLAPLLGPDHLGPLN